MHADVVVGSATDEKSGQLRAVAQQLVGVIRYWNPRPSRPRVRERREHCVGREQGRDAWC